MMWSFWRDDDALNGRLGITIHLMNTPKRKHSLHIVLNIGHQDGLDILASNFANFGRVGAESFV